MQNLQTGKPVSVFFCLLLASEFWVLDSLFFIPAPS